MICKNCNSIIPDAAAFCPNCATAVDDMDETGLLNEESVNPADDFGDTGLLQEDDIKIDDFGDTGLLEENEPFTPPVKDMNFNGVPSDVDYANQNARSAIGQDVQDAYKNPAFNSTSNYAYGNGNDIYYNSNQSGSNGNISYSGTVNAASSAPSTEEPSLIGCYKKFWKNYANFNGRARRSEYWYAFLMNAIICTVVSVLMAIPVLRIVISVVFSLYTLAIFIPMLSLVVRRLHDIGKDWYWIFFGLIPIAGAIMMIIWYCQDSQPGPNQFGENPKGVNIYMN